MKIGDIENVCWICGRTEEELKKPFEDSDFSIPLRDLEDQYMYSGYRICDICESIIVTVGGYSSESLDEIVSEKLAEFKENLKDDIIKAIKSIL